MSTPKSNAFAAAREQALTEITPHLQPPLDNTHPKWRVILTDSESLTGLAPVCNQPGSDALHEITDYPGGPKRDDDGVYDCCPWPQIDTYSEALATYLVGLLNADTEQAVKAATPDAEAYDGELAMLRGLVRTLRVIVRADGSPEKQRAEVRQLLAQHAGDEAHARLLAMETASAYGAPKFFQVGHGYSHRDGSDFRCVAVTAHPVTGEPRALGWIVRNGWHDAGALDPDDWTHAYDGCEPPADTQGDSK